MFLSTWKALIHPIWTSNAKVMELNWGAIGASFSITNLLDLILNSIFTIKKKVYKIQFYC